MRRLATETAVYSRLPVVLRCDNPQQMVTFARFYPGILGLRGASALDAEDRGRAASYAATEVA